MSPERKGFQQIIKTVGQKIDYFLQGRSPEEDARIIRLVTNPSSISQKDRTLFMSEQVVNHLSKPGESALCAMLIEQNLESLPQDKFDTNVIRDAIFKANLWGLIPKTQQPHP